MEWARTALGRNPNLEVLGADADTGVVTVRYKHNGEIHALKIGDLAAAPIAQLAATPTTSPEPVQPAVETEATSTDVETAPDDAWVEPAAPSEAPAAAPLKYTIERNGSKVRVIGPGVTIVSSGGEHVTTARGEPGQSTVEPIVCEGQQMMHLDSRRIFVDGNAVTARNGCELHITNSRIVASGTGVVVRDAVVHITNSYIEGATGSYDAGIGARMYLSDSTFEGTRFRDAFAQIQEQGADTQP